MSVENPAIVESSNDNDEEIEPETLALLEQIEIVREYLETCGEW